MRLGISAWRLNGPRFGVARYTEYLVSHWSKQLSKNDSLTLYLHSPLEEKIPAAGVPINEVVVTPKLTNAVWENLLLPRACKDLDLLFGPSYTLPLLYKGKRVVSIHSVNEAEAGNHSLAYKLSYSLKYRMSARVADRVIVNSQSTKERVVDYYNIPSDKVDVVWLGTDSAFRPNTAHDAGQQKRDTQLQYLGKEQPFILFVGTMSQRRNIPMLMKAFSLAKHRHKLPHSLLLVGRNAENLPLADMARQLGIADCVVHMGGSFASHQGIVPIYNAADLYVLPSESEGFSLTLAEAMSCGVPVITSSRSSLGEVANNYALTLDQITEETLADSIVQVLSDNDLQQKLRQSGLERAKSLRWEVCAQKTLDILRDVAGH